MPPTGLRTSRTWILEFQERSTTLSDDVGGGATTARAATLRTVTSRVKKKKVRLNLNPIPLTPTPPVNRGLDQRRTPRPLRRTVCPRPQTLACLSPWITLGRTWLSSMSLQTLRAVNYTWILSRMWRNRTRGLIRRGGGVAREETTESVIPTTIRRSSTELQRWLQIYHCLSKLFCWQKKKTT